LVDLAFACRPNYLFTGLFTNPDAEPLSLKKTKQRTQIEINRDASRSQHR
jgi:hypothetical protein